ncbi:Rieske (2Fe-2S) protein [Nonomuraea sp. NPDC050328]|uniref:Rieske (2Fe-2S) protein n=1 Tax=Nonomuraea sp. NPDC050328 TaxID=3364361 RepID=UPI00379208F1
MADKTRRAVVLGASGAGLAAVLTACSGYGQQADTSAQVEDGGAGETKAPKPQGKGGGSKGKALASAGDIPEGGGKIFKDAKVVVTQPTAGEFKCFSAVCTHQGCTVGSVSGGTINCPCHGSKFDIADGSVANGPASEPLPEKKIKVEGDTITLS